MYEQDTIAAIATAPGEAAVAIVRISGIDAEKIAAKIFVRGENKQGRLASHKLYHGTIRDPRTAQILDEVLLTVMRGPRSYTGEDVVEVHCHGGVFLCGEILRLILVQGARHAEPGEFTRRAFLNGKLDLTQAEAVLDVIRARTLTSAELALSQASGSLSAHIAVLRQDLLDILVQVEAAIDFPDEEIELLQGHQLVAKIVRLANKINEISATYDWGRLYREGAKVCLCGRPNVGKSSLLNALLGANRVIVTAIPGTTRDVIEEVINLDGLPVALWDTAGIRDAGDEVERLGVELSREHVEKADAVMVVLDGSEPLASEDLTLIRSVGKRKKLVTINKSDLPMKLSFDDLVGSVTRADCVSASAKTGAGIEQLKIQLRQLLLDHQAEPGPVLTNIRHRGSLMRAADGLAAAAQALRSGLPPELVAVNLNEAREGLEEIVGLINSENILEQVFSNFCIGK
jgi:tRNA modification GTPase